MTARVSNSRPSSGISAFTNGGCTKRRQSRGKRPGAGNPLGQQASARIPGASPHRIAGLYCGRIVQAEPPMRGFTMPLNLDAASLAHAGCACPPPRLAAA